MTTFSAQINLSIEAEDLGAANKLLSGLEDSLRSNFAATPLLCDRLSVTGSAVGGTELSKCPCGCDLADDVDYEEKHRSAA